MNALKLFVKMLRPQVAVVLVLFAVLGMAQGGYRQQLVWQLLGVVIVIVAWWVNATTINDLADYEIDRINLKGAAERPLANKQATRRQIMALSLFSAMAGLGVGFVLDARIGVLVLICLLLNYAYSMPPAKISHRGAQAPLLLPIGYVVLPYLVGAWSLDESITRKGQLILAAIYISFIGRIILKDFRDVKGDAKFGKRTFLLRYGRKATCITSAIGLAVGSSILLAVIPLNLVIVFIFEALLGCALFGLYKLYKTHGRVVELIVIGSIVRAASGAVIILLALLLLQNNGKPLSQQVLATAALGLYFIAQFWDTLKKAEAVKRRA
jgi:4-hydroxybenzoate polyprenyltransferase